MKDPRDIIIRPIISEESMMETDNNKYTFEVDQKVNTMNMKGKVKRRGMDVGRRKNWKKAIVTLTDDSKAIEMFSN